jgi:hypothetical protein
MTSITATFLTLPAAFLIGHSVDGRRIDAVHVGGKAPDVLVVGCIHGNECAALPVVRARAGVACAARIHSTAAPSITVWFHQPQTVARAWGRSRGGTSLSS